MTQCMANEQFKFYQNGQICDTKIYFEDWEDNSPADWTSSTHFDTIEECCANEFWFDYDGCVNRSPVFFKFEFCVEIEGLVEPTDCQSADIFANVLEDAINEGCHHNFGLSNSTDRKLHTDGHEYFGDVTTADANITKIGGVSLAKVDGSTVCGGTLGGQSFTNDMTGTLPDYDAAVGTMTSVCGVITVEEENCKEETCLQEHYEALAHELQHFVNDGDLTIAINNRAMNRLPPEPALYQVTAVPFSMSTQNLLLPATITGDLDLKFYHGSDLNTCMEKAVFQAHETPYDKLYDCCTRHFQWDVEGCCSKGGGCPEIGVPGIDSGRRLVELKYTPTWVAPDYCVGKATLEDWEVGFSTRDECCDAIFDADADQASNNACKSYVDPTKDI